MTKLVNMLVVIAAIWFFFFLLPSWKESSDKQRQAEVNSAPINGPALKPDKTKFGEIKRARLEGSKNRNVELIEYPNGLVCVKFFVDSSASGRGAGIDCDWGNYNKEKKSNE